ncbi:MAG: helix-turn-helix domain-containing protein [Bacillus sp. (in: Bacteria)]|nr:helix-turn-helix domain-containing protein [Bacillus sp. (in: firmicutes)]
MTNNNVQSVERALKILNTLAQYPEGIGITELSNKLQLAKSTTHRLILTLMNNNYVIQDSKTENYRLGMHIVSLSSSV